MVSVDLQNGAYVPHGFDGLDHWHKVPDPRRRMAVKFWIDLDKELSQWAVEAMKSLKGERLFKQTMMEGFRLVIELRNKKLDYLFELFPFIEAWMDTEIKREVERQVALRVAELQPAAPETSALEARLAKLEALLAGQGAPTPGPKPLTPAPADDADDGLLVVRKAESDGASANKNFLDSAFNLANK